MGGLRLLKLFLEVDVFRVEVGTIGESSEEDINGLHPPFLSLNSKSLRFTSKKSICPNSGTGSVSVIANIFPFVFDRKNRVNFYQ